MKDETRSFYEAAVLRAATRITRSLDDALDLTSIAREAALSPFHFHRIFRGMVGETPLELHRRLRLERAALALLTTKAPVTTIAFDAGYETHEAFTRAFRDAYGAPPSAFRAMSSHAPLAAKRRPIEIATRSGIHVSIDGAPILPAVRFPEGDPTMHVTIVDMPSLRLASVRHVGPYTQIVDAFARLDSIVRPAGLLRADTQMLAIYHDDPETTPAADLRADAAITLSPNDPLPSGLVEAHLPAGRYAKTTHEGPYRTLGDTWARLMGAWLPASGERVADRSSFEVYRNTPETVAPADLRTDLHLPLV